MSDRYTWDDYYGVTEIVKPAITPRQALQLLNCGNKRFRIKCGKLLVEALNKEAREK